jgi:aspartyl-tRNA(Asn)/glutamyl-tRNA(Gln) amidotransferase subunit A
MTAIPSTIEAAAAALRERRLSARELLEACLERADRLDGDVGSFVSRCDDEARAAADRADGLFARGERISPLQGIPVAVKDILGQAGLPTTAQSRALPAAWALPEDAVAVRGLRDAGAVLVGKTTTMEFALGMPDPEQPFPLPRNPWDLDRWSGGSSSGTANGLAAGFFLGGVGTDSGGSIRLPSAFCGVTGLKPTAGLVSRDGCLPLAPSLDTVGPMARSARDCGRLLDAMTGADARPWGEATGADRPLAGVAVGVERTLQARPGVDEGAAAAFDAATTDLAELGATVVDTTIPGYDELAIASQVVLLTESFAVHRTNLERVWSRYGTHTRRRLVHGAFFTAEDVARAHRVLRAGRRLVDELLEGVDVLACLTAGSGSERIEGLGLDGHMATAGVTFTRIWNPLGLPAISLPAGFTSDGMPVGLQLVGRSLGELELVRIADAFQRHTSWHALEPPLAPSSASPTTRS